MVELHIEYPRLEAIVKMMRAVSGVLLVAAFFASTSVLAAGHPRGGGFHGGGVRHYGGFHGGPRLGIVLAAPLLAAPLFLPRYYPSYYPAVVAAPAAPPVYIEQAMPQVNSNWWYYCREAQAYYPYVAQCAGAWERVAPQPAP